MSEYDVIVVGGGAAGGIVAGVLSEAGKRVLLLERGRNLSFADEKRDHLRNHRFGPYGHNTGPDLVGNPRVTVDENGRARIVNPIEGGYENNAMCVGGGTLIWGMQSWRFAPTDFRMASHYGVPEGSSLADWPISYDDLEPYYERAEWQVGVAGDASKLTHEGYRKREFPMPAVPDNPSRLLLTEGAKSLGWKSHPVPLAINSVPYNGRQACIQCAECVGYQCPTDAKNGSRNTLFVRAIASGNCTVVTQAIAEKIETDSQGHVTGVSYFVDHGSTVERVTASASQVVVSGGAVESARLLLNSKSDMHPNGLGNANDQVGRNFFGHIYTGAYAQMPTNVIDGLGPGVTIGTTQFVHDNPGIVGGGLLANEFIKTPIHFVNAAMARELPARRAGLRAVQRYPDGEQPHRSRPGRARQVRHPGRSPLRPQSSRHAEDGGLPTSPCGGLAARKRRGEGLEHAQRRSRQRRPASSGHLPHGRRSEVVGHRQVGPRPRPRQSVRRRWLSARDRRRLQPRPHDHGPRLPLRRALGESVGAPSSPSPSSSLPHILGEGRGTRFRLPIRLSRFPCRACTGL
jgi:choline dehydrogenase-like flavoprotein